MTSGLAPVTLAQPEGEDGALSELAFAQRLYTAHPSSRIVHALSHQIGRLANDALGQKISGLASSRNLHFTNLAYFT